jgi:hypothetical protein
MNKLAAISLFSALATLSAFASAAWTSQAKVTRVRTFTGSDKVEIWFDQNVTTGCTYNDRVVLDTSYVTADRIDRAQALASAARLSQRDVEVNTLSGCVGSGGRLDYLSLK